MEFQQVRITQEHVGGLTIMRVKGLDAGRLEAAGLRVMVSALIEQKRLDVAINLAKVTFVDAEVLGALVHAFTRLKGLGGSLALIAPPERVRRLLSITRLDTIVPLFASELEAVARFSADAPKASDRRSWFSLPAPLVGA
jgi:anti-sigma B factor antagonist